MLIQNIVVFKFNMTTMMIIIIIIILDFLRATFLMQTVPD